MFIICHFFPFFYAQITRIAVDHLVVFSNQLRCHRHIVDIGGRHLYCVGIACPGVHTHMALHPKPPLISLFGRVHLRVPFLFCVFGRTGRVDDGGIHNCSALHDVSCLHHHPVDGLKKQFVQPMFLQQMPEIQQRRLIRHTVLQKINPGKLSHGIAVVDSVLRARIGQVEPDLQQIHPQHQFQINGWSAVLSCWIRAG